MTSNEKASTDEIRGYLFFQSVEKFLKKKRETLFDEFVEPSPASGRLSYSGNGWYKITHSILDGEFVKIAAHRDAIIVEAKFNMVTTVPEDDNGFYEIKGGLFAGSGTFLNISRKPREDLDFQAKDNADFTHFFVCNSHSLQKGIPFLRWRMVLREFSN